MRIINKKQIIKIIYVQLLIIFVFSLIYYKMDSKNFNFRNRNNYNNSNNSNNHFIFRYKDENTKVSFLDFFYFSTVTSASTGFGDITPKTREAKIVVTIQILLTYTNILSIFFLN